VEFSFRRIAFALALFAGGILPLALPAASVPLGEVGAIRLATDGGATRVELQLSAATPYSFFMLDGPRRAVVDLQRTRLAPGRVLPLPAGLVRGLRAAPRPGGGLRLVIDLPEGSGASAAWLPPQPGVAARLVVSLGPAGSGGADATAATGEGGTPSTAASLPAVPAAEASTLPVRAAHAPADSGRAVIVAVDAGHGGQDPGAIGRSGTREKDVVLEIAREVAARINREPGMRAVLTRQGDHFLTLRQRIGRARQAKADMFVSIHADSVRDRDVSGASVYVLSEKGASDEQARWLAERENAADLKGGVSLDDKDGMLASVLLDLSQSASIASSMHAAERVLRSLNRVAEVRKPRVQQAGFVVLKSPDIPSMLVETAFISNAADERMLRQSERRERLAAAIFRGVHSYFEDHPPEGTRFAAVRRALPPATAQAGR
jgi:N-acetylmuramoyl-L-alanine amidase